MAQQDQKFDVDKVAANVGLSKWHFCRVFKNYTGYTPRKFYLQSRGGKITPQPLPLIRTKKFLQQKKREKIHEQIESLLRSLPDSLFNSENEGGDLVVGGDKAIVDDKFGGVNMIGKFGGSLEEMKRLQGILRLGEMIYLGEIIRLEDTTRIRHLQARIHLEVIHWGARYSEDYVGEQGTQGVYKPTLRPRQAIKTQAGY
ncbi:CIC11C00000001518 [Sungouiella intermedia]|uniref:CIC11C00000001518 n=1 Tax=Sungouiella intermedia TaxID=45354 RepID=A0A1L0BLN9_9ASCO|nr:CIC11C00000001518 [[Candida] intermedia]